LALPSMSFLPAAQISYLPEICLYKQGPRKTRGGTKKLC
jgi:hypothetical protein